MKRKEKRGVEPMKGEASTQGRPSTRPRGQNRRGGQLWANDCMYSDHGGSRERQKRKNITPRVRGTRPVRPIGGVKGKGGKTAIQKNRQVHHKMYAKPTET